MLEGRVPHHAPFGQEQKKETKNDGIVGKSSISRFSAFFWEAAIIIKGPHVDKIPSSPLPKFLNLL